MSDTEASKIDTAKLAEDVVPVSSPCVYVIDDDIQIRRSLHALLASMGIVSWPFASGTDFLDSLKSLQPAPILLDLRMPEVDGLRFMSLIADQGIEWPIIMMTAYGEIPVVIQAIKLGAIEFLEKPFAFESLEAALQAAFARLKTVLKHNAIRDDARQRIALLTRRESEVLDILMNGIPNKVAAYALSLSPRTIEMHRSNALMKLNVKSLAEAVRLATDAKTPFRAFAKDNDNANI